ncbi:hypothetical protein [Streptomyces sp. NPDC003719]
MTDPETVRGLDEAAHTELWAGGGRSMWLAVGMERVTGRRIVPADGS